MIKELSQPRLRKSGSLRISPGRELRPRHFLRGGPSLGWGGYCPGAPPRPWPPGVYHWIAWAFSTSVFFLGIVFRVLSLLLCHQPGLLLQRDPLLCELQTCFRRLRLCGHLLPLPVSLLLRGTGLRGPPSAALSASSGLTQPGASQLSPSTTVQLHIAQWTDRPGASSARAPSQILPHNPLAL